MAAKKDLRTQIRQVMHRMLVWGRDKVPMGVRTLVGLLLCVGGVFGFLPILGFWMFPLGLAFIALDVPPLRSRIDRWIAQLEKELEHQSDQP